MERPIADLETRPGGIDPGAGRGASPSCAGCRTTTSSSWARATTTIRARKDGDYAAEEPLYQPGDGLGVLRDPERTVLRRANEPAVLTAQMKRQLDLARPGRPWPSPTCARRVHRRAYMDYVGVKRFGADGRPSGEIRFVGLFTAEAYDEPAAEVPLIRAQGRRRPGPRRQGAGQPQREAPAATSSRTIRATSSSRSTEDELLAHRAGHPAPATTGRGCGCSPAATRSTASSRSCCSCRASATTPSVRERAGEILAEAWGGRLSAWLSAASPTRRWCASTTSSASRPATTASPTCASVEAEIAEAARTWEDRFEAAVRASGRDAATRSPTTLARYARRLPGRLPRPLSTPPRPWPTSAVIDGLATATADPRRAPTARAADGPLQFRFKLYRRGDAGAAGRRAADPGEHGAEGARGVRLRHPPDRARTPIWVHEFLIEDPRGGDLVFDEVKGAVRGRLRRRSGPAAPRATASTAWCWSWASPGARRP